MMLLNDVKTLKLFFKKNIQKEEPLFLRISGGRLLKRHGRLSFLSHLKESEQFKDALHIPTENMITSLFRYVFH